MKEQSVILGVAQLMCDIPFDMRNSPKRMEALRAFQAMDEVTEIAILRASTTKWLSAYKVIIPYDLHIKWGCSSVCARAFGAT